VGCFHTHNEDKAVELFIGLFLGGLVVAAGLTWVEKRRNEREQRQVLAAGKVVISLLQEALCRQLLPGEMTAVFGMVRNAMGLAVLGPGFAELLPLVTELHERERVLWDDLIGELRRPRAHQSAPKSSPSRAMELVK
jgi:hypothetical protein